jgi:hypothetical protein
MFKLRKDGSMIKAVDPAKPEPATFMKLRLLLNLSVLSICAFAANGKEPGGLILNQAMPDWSRKELTRMGYKLYFQPRTSGPINAIYFDWQHKSFWGGSSNHGEDYGIGW